MIKDSAYYQANNKNVIHLIEFANKQSTNIECIYTTIEWKYLAMVFSIRKICHYFLMNKAIFYINHMALRYIIDKLDLSCRL